MKTLEIPGNNGPRIYGKSHCQDLDPDLLFPNLTFLSFLPFLMVKLCKIIELFQPLFISNFASSEIFIPQSSQRDLFKKYTFSCPTLLKIFSNPPVTFGIKGPTQSLTYLPSNPNIIFIHLLLIFYSISSKFIREHLRSLINFTLSFLYSFIPPVFVACHLFMTGPGDTRMTCHVFYSQSLGVTRLLHPVGFYICNTKRKAIEISKRMPNIAWVNGQGVILRRFLIELQGACSNSPCCQAGSGEETTELSDWVWRRTVSG